MTQRWATPTPSRSPLSDPPLPQQTVYQMMLEIHDAYSMHSVFQPGFPGLLEGFYVQEKLIEHLMPDVYTSFVSEGVVLRDARFDHNATQQKNMISASSYAAKWYITLFANTVPFQTQLRIWDAMFLDGRNVVVMTSVAIIWAFRGEHRRLARFDPHD